MTSNILFTQPANKITKISPAIFNKNKQKSYSFKYHLKKAIKKFNINDTNISIDANADIYIPYNNSYNDSYNDLYNNIVFMNKVNFLYEKIGGI